MTAQKSENENTYVEHNMREAGVGGEDGVGRDGEARANQVDGKMERTYMRPTKAEGKWLAVGGPDWVGIDASAIEWWRQSNGANRLLCIRRGRSNIHDMGRMR